MSASHRICETCVYCSFAGNCDRYDKPLTSIEQPACDAYEIHPLLAENVKLRELTRDMFDGMCGYGHDCRCCEHYELYEGQRFVGECEYHRRIRELGVGVPE